MRASLFFPLYIYRLYFALSSSYFKPWTCSSFRSFYLSFYGIFLKSHLDPSLCTFPLNCVYLTLNSWVNFSSLILYFENSFIYPICNQSIYFCRLLKKLRVYNLFISLYLFYSMNFCVNLTWKLPTIIYTPLIRITYSRSLL